MFALLRDPDQLERLKADPSLIESAVEELLRYDGPVQRTDRIAHHDIEVGGASIRQGERVTVSLGAANRDPAQFPEPDRLDAARANNRHLAFGGACITVWARRWHGSRPR
jgi:pimeloyl-[acyl-carrier protein] synthase